MMQKIIIFVVAVQIILACHHNSVPASTLQVALPLENTHWKLVAITGLKGDFPAFTKEVFLLMKDGKMNGSSGCNNYFGAYKLDHGHLQFSAVADTKMYCDKVMDVEGRLYKAFANTSNYRIQASLLFLLKGDSTLAQFEGTMPNK
jgi:heat shock protein HslJ